MQCRASLGRLLIQIHTSEQTTGFSHLTQCIAWNRLKMGNRTLEVGLQAVTCFEWGSLRYVERFYRPASLPDAGLSLLAPARKGKKCNKLGKPCHINIRQSSQVLFFSRIFSSSCTFNALITPVCPADNHKVKNTTPKELLLSNWNTDTQTKSFSC